MRTVRDSISDAIDRSLAELKSKPQAQQAAFAAKSVAHNSQPGIEKVLNDAKNALKDLEDDDLLVAFIHASDPNVVLMPSVLESAPQEDDRAFRGPE